MKQVIVVRKDLNMTPGKCAAQCCHASLMSYLLTTKDGKKGDMDAAEWFRDGQTKIIVMVENEEELVELRRKVDSDPLLKDRNYLVRDAGHTELKGQNLTCLGIGPAAEKSIDQYTRELKLYR